MSEMLVVSTHTYVHVEGQPTWVTIHSPSTTIFSGSGWEMEMEETEKFLTIMKDQ